MDFQTRLERAIERGVRAGDAHARARHERALNEEELKRLHADYRLQLSDHIEGCLERLPDYFPGFQLQTLVNDVGWGAAVSRDDVVLDHDARRRTAFSRLELVIRPFSSSHMLDLTAKATIRNKEVYNRSHYQPIEQAHPTAFMEIIDLWVLEFAELYAASNKSSLPAAVREEFGEKRGLEGM